MAPLPNDANILNRNLMNLNIETNYETTFSNEDSCEYGDKNFA